MPLTKGIKNDAKQKKLTSMGFKTGPSTFPTRTRKQEERRRRDPKKCIVDLIHPKKVDESLLPVSFEDFRKYTNIVAVGIEEMKRTHPRTYQERAKDQSTLLKYARDYYVIFFTEPKYRRYKPLEMLKINDDCPPEMAGRISTINGTHEHKEARQHRPRQLKKTIPCFTFLNEKPKTDNNERFPVSLHMFKKYSYYDVTVDEILKECSLANNEKYERLKKDFETRERVLHNYFRAFYIHPSIRESYELRLKPCPAHVKNLILKTPEASNATKQHQSSGVSKAVEVSAPGVQHNSAFHSGDLDLVAGSSAGKQIMSLVQLGQRHQISNAFAQVEASKENIVLVQEGSPEQMYMKSTAASSSPPNTSLTSSRMNSALTELNKIHSQNINLDESNFPIGFSEFIGGTNIMDIVRDKFNVESSQRSEEIARNLYKQLFIDAKCYADIFDHLMISYKLIKKIKAGSNLAKSQETKRSVSTVEKTSMEATSREGEKERQQMSLRQKIQHSKPQKPSDLVQDGTSSDNIPANNSEIEQVAEEAARKTPAAASMQRRNTSFQRFLSEYIASAGIVSSKPVEELAHLKSKVVCPSASAGKARDRVQIQSLEIIQPYISDSTDGQKGISNKFGPPANGIQTAALKSTQKPVETQLTTESQSDFGTPSVLETDGITITPTVATTQAPIEADEMQTQIAVIQKSEQRHSTQLLDQLSVFDYDALVKTPTKVTSTQNADKGPNEIPTEAGFSQPKTCSTQSLAPSLPHSSEHNRYRLPIQNISPNIFSDSSSASYLAKVLQTYEQPPSSGKCGSPNFATTPSNQTQLEALPYEEHEISDPLDAEMALICEGIAIGKCVKIKTEPGLLNNFQFALDDHSQVVCVGQLSQEVIKVDDEEMRANDDFFDFQPEQTQLQQQIETMSPQCETPDSTLGVISEGQKIPSSCESEIASQSQDIGPAVPTTIIPQIPLEPTKTSTTRATVCRKITDNVPQLTHGFRALHLVTLTKNAPPPAAVVAPNTGTSSSTIANSSNSTKSLSVSQALTTDCTLFNNSSLLRKLDQQPAPITTTTAASTSSISTINVISNSMTISSTSSCPSTTAQQKVKDIDHLGSKLHKTLLCRTLLQFHYFEELLEQHIAEYELPTMCVGQRYMQALIHCGGHKTIMYGGNSLRLLLSHCPAGLFSDLHYVLSDLREFHYNFGQRRCIKKVDALRARVVLHFLQSSPAFCHCLLKFECYTREFGYLQVLSPPTEETLTHRLHRPLVEALKPAILARIAKLKAKL